MSGAGRPARLPRLIGRTHGPCFMTPKPVSPCRNPRQPAFSSWTCRFKLVRSSVSPFRRALVQTFLSPPPAAHRLRRRECAPCPGENFAFRECDCARTRGSVARPPSRMTKTHPVRHRAGARQRIAGVFRRLPAGDRQGPVVSCARLGVRRARLRPGIRQIGTPCPP